MGGFFGTISRKDCKYDVFFGTDYHSHLGTRRGGMAFYDERKGFQRQIHNIENTPFRTKFEGDLPKFCGHAGIDLDAVDALSLAEQAGSSKAVNLVLMGKLSKYFDIPQEEWLAAIEQSVPSKFLEMNKKAFALGANA